MRADSRVPRVDRRGRDPVRDLGPGQRRAPRAEVPRGAVAILLPYTDRAGAERVAGEIVALVREHGRRAADPTLRITTSVGVTMIRDPAVDLDVLMHAADKTMYAAKLAGRDRFLLVDDPTSAPHGG